MKKKTRGKILRYGSCVEKDFEPSVSKPSFNPPPQKPKKSYISLRANTIFIDEYAGDEFYNMINNKEEKEKLWIYGKLLNY